MAKSGVYTYTFTVPEAAIDFNGHVGNVTYLQWMVEAATRHSASRGWSMEKCLKAGGTWVAKKHCIEYLRPAFAGQRLRMRTWLESIEKIRAVRRYEILDDESGTLLAKGESEWIFVDAERFRPMRIPEKIVASFVEGGGEEHDGDEGRQSK